jgi:predicted permease
MVAQVALSVLLLVAAGLFVRSLRHARSIDPGFDAAGVLTASVDLETHGYSESRGRALIQSLTRRLETAPGIDAVNVADIVPLTLSNSTTFLLRDADVPPALGQRPPTPPIYTNAVAPGHFRTLRIPLLAGRDFSDRDAAAGSRVAIVNETLARTFWPGDDALGQRLRPLRAADASEIIEVVGVVRDTKYVTLGEAPRPFLYRPLSQAYTPRLTMLVRSANPPESAAAAIRQAVRELDSTLAVFNVALLSDAMSVSLLPAQIAGTLLGGLGILALALAALGVYAVLSFLVRSRTPEIGLRVALGATPRAVAALVVRQAATWIVGGMVIGMAIAFAASRLLGAFLFGISPTDPVTFAGVALLLGLVALMAALVPAVRASRLDPLVALRRL